jgi:hypothetical protein
MLKTQSCAADAEAGGSVLPSVLSASVDGTQHAWTEANGRRKLAQTDFVNHQTSLS